MATQTATVEVKLTSKTQGLQSGLNKSKKDLEKLGKTGQDAQKKLSKGGKGIQESFRS